MNRPKYTFTDADRYTAVAYLRTKLLDLAWPSDDIAVQLAASRTFKKASRDSVTLTTWCEKHLDADQMVKLKNTLRQKRKRTKDLSRAGGKPIGVTLSHKAWRILHDLAEADGVTLSQVIEDRLSVAWNRL